MTSFWNDKLVWKQYLEYLMWVLHALRLRSYRWSCISVDQDALQHIFCPDRDWWSWSIPWKDFPQRSEMWMESLSKASPGHLHWESSLWHRHCTVLVVLHPGGQCALFSRTYIFVCGADVSGHWTCLGAGHQAEDGLYGHDPNEPWQTSATWARNSCTVLCYHFVETLSCGC